MSRLSRAFRGVARIATGGLIGSAMGGVFGSFLGGALRGGLAPKAPSAPALPSTPNYGDPALTAAAEDERRRSLRGRSGNFFTSSQGVLSTPTLASRSLFGG